MSSRELLKSCNLKYEILLLGKFPCSFWQNLIYIYSWVWKLQLWLWKGVWSLLCCCSQWPVFIHDLVLILVLGPPSGYHYNANFFLLFLLLLLLSSFFFLSPFFLSDSSRVLILPSLTCYIHVKEILSFFFAIHCIGYCSERAFLCVLSVNIFSVGSVKAGLKIH